MRAVGVRELKNRLSEYLRRVRGGEEILVTDRGEVIAELRRPAPRADVPYPGLMHWVLFRLEEEIVERASRPFPREPIRTLDAIHLATALLAQSLVPDLALLSLDDRVRENGARMGFRLLPETVRGG